MNSALTAIILVHQDRSNWPIKEILIKKVPFHLDRALNFERPICFRSRWDILGKMGHAFIIAENTKKNKKTIKLTSILWRDICLSFSVLKQMGSCARLEANVTKCVHDLESSGYVLQMVYESCR
jgi:hypothetical protein